MIVISDTSAICYLLLIKQIDILPTLYTSIIIPLTIDVSDRTPVTLGEVRSWAVSK